jgi:hypothetical protein
MALSAILSNQFKKALLNKQIDIDTDTIKALLMRSGWTFDKDKHLQKKNVKCNSGAISLTFTAATKKISRTAGSFVTDGFVTGMKITTDAALNPGPFTIVSAVALEITVSETVTDEGPVTKTVTGDDELAAGNGYSQDTKTVTITLSLNLTDDRAEGAFASFSWVASGGSIGPTPGVLFYDSTDADNTILGFLSFGTEVTAEAGSAISVSNAQLRLA